MWLVRHLITMLNTILRNLARAIPHVRKDISSSSLKPITPGRRFILSHQQGFTFLMAMFFVALVGISLMTIGQQWSVTMKRDREAELLFRGNRIKEAIERYAADFEVQKGIRTNRFPRALKDLVKKDPKRYLQAIYKDPMTGEDFVLIKQGAEIKGVRSASKEVPYDQVHFEGAGSYDAIRFEATPPAANCTPNPVNPLLPANCPKGPPTKEKTASSAAKSAKTPSNPLSE